MRHLLCAGCSKAKRAGERQSWPADGVGPAEHERVVLGTAKEPLAENRVMTVVADAADATTLTLPPDHYDCDSCGKSIKPGDRCCAHSVWLAYQTAPPPWEAEYLTPDPPYNPVCAKCFRDGAAHRDGAAGHSFVFGPITEDEGRVTGQADA